jgi:hypothetical protein
MEASFGASFADVQVHPDDERPGAIGTYAFTRGSHLHFMPGLYRPHTAAGRRVIGHELAHVLQQRAGRVGRPHGPGEPLSDDRALEAEADRLGTGAARGRQAPGVDGPRAGLHAGGTLEHDAGSATAPDGAVADPASGSAASAAPVHSGAGETSGVVQGMKIIINGVEVEIPDEDFLQDMFDVTMDRQEELAKLNPELVKHVPLPTEPEIRGLPWKPTDLPVKELDISTEKPIDSLLLARGYLQNNSLFNATLNFHAPQQKRMRKKLQQSARAKAANRGWFMPGGAYGPKPAKTDEDDEEIVEAQRGRSVLESRQKLEESVAKTLAKKRKRTEPEDEDRLKARRVVSKGVRRIFRGQRKGLPEELETRDELKELLPPITTGFAESMRAIQMLPISIMLEDILKEGEDPQKAYSDPGFYPPVGPGTEKKLRSIHTYYARNRRFQGEEQQAFDQAKSVHDKMKTMTTRWIAREKVKTRSIPSAFNYWKEQTKESNVQGKDDPETRDRARQVLKIMMQRKFLRSADYPKVTTS